MAREFAHLIRRRSRSSRRRRGVDDDSEELPIDNVNSTTSAGPSTIPRRHRLKRPQLPLPSRLHHSNSASPSSSVLSPPSPMATSVGSRNNSSGRPPPAPTKPTTSVMKDSRSNKDMPSINSKPSLGAKTTSPPHKSFIVTRNGIDQQQRPIMAVDLKKTISTDNRDRSTTPSGGGGGGGATHHPSSPCPQQIGRFSIIDERPKDPGSLESDFDDLDDSISSQTPASPLATGR